MSTISLIIRQFYLPNPFEYLGWVQGNIVNWIVGIILHPICFGIVGLFYMKGSAPAWGSFLYLITYSAFTFILYLMGLFEFVWWWVICVILMLIATPFVIKFIFWGLGQLLGLIIDGVACLVVKIKEKTKGKEVNDGRKTKEEKRRNKSKY